MNTQYSAGHLALLQVLDEMPARLREQILARAAELEQQFGQDDKWLQIKLAREQQAQPVAEGEKDIRLFDSQWVNIVNHDHCWLGWSMGKAIHEAVRLAEKYMRENIEKGFPNKRTAPAQAQPPAGDIVEQGSTSVPNSALKWLFGEEGKFECHPDNYFRGKPPQFWWRSEFQRQIDAAKPICKFCGPIGDGSVNAIAWCGKEDCPQKPEGFPTFIKDKAVRPDSEMLDGRFTRETMVQDASPKDARLDRILKETQAGEADEINARLSAEAFKDAWYEIAYLLGIGAQSASPKEVHDNQVMPRLRALRALEASDLKQYHAAAPDTTPVPDTIGSPSPMPSAKDEWMAKYCLRLVERGGMNQDEALSYYAAGDYVHDYESDPVEAADEEMSYWDNDGDELA